MSTCCCILRAQDETVDTEELSRLLADHSPTDATPLFVSRSETGFGINWQKQFFVIKRMAYPVLQHQIALLGSEQLVADLSGHGAHLLVFHIQGEGHRIDQTKIFTKLLSALSTFGMAVMWRDHTLFSSCEWQEFTRREMDVSQWIAVAKLEHDGVEWIRTYGLDCFERPEIALRVASNGVGHTIGFVKSFAAFLIENQFDFVENDVIDGDPFSFTVERVDKDAESRELIYLTAEE